MLQKESRGNNEHTKEKKEQRISISKGVYEIVFSRRSFWDVSLATLNKGFIVIFDRLNIVVNSSIWGALAIMDTVSII